MRILFHISPEPGHFDATVPLALALARRDHEVVYSAIEDVQPMVEARGFRCALIHRRAVPRGALAAIAQAPAAEARDWAAVELGDRIADDYFRGTMETVVRQIDPAIVIADIATFSPIQFALYRLGVPCLQISLSLSQRYDELPPLTSPLAPETPLPNLAAARWGESCLHRCVGSLRIPMIVSAMPDRYAARFGYASEHISFDAALYPALTAFPEVIACASALDFPRTAAGPSFLAVPIELDRDEEVPVALATFVDRARPLIYVTLGDQLGRSPRMVQFFEAVAGALEARPAWHAVIAADPHVELPASTKLPSNVLLLSHAPRLWLLRRAAVFATDADLLGVREAIALHVPIIAVPQRHDQPGNATRVAHHGLGVHISPDLITSTSLAGAIERALGNADGYRARLGELDEACRVEEAAHRGVELIERLAVIRRRDLGELRDSVITAGAPVNAAGPGWKFIDEPDLVALELTCYPTLGDALANAEGALLARVQVSGNMSHDEGRIVGQAPRFLWVIDASDALYDYAEWCAAMAFEPELAGSAARVELFRDLLAQHRSLRRRGAPPDQLNAVFRATREHAVKYWHRGYGAAAFAMGPLPHQAAQLARLEAMLSLARHEVGDLVGTPQGADRCEQVYRGLVACFDVELERRIAIGAPHD